MSDTANTYSKLRALMKETYSSGKKIPKKKKKS